LSTTIVWCSTERTLGHVDGDVWADILKRRFIFMGMVSFTIMLLAITSTAGWVRLKKVVTLHRW
jgi:DMSO/TMAO reductase YedYZ heme-binding membrane subunit